MDDFDIFSSTPATTEVKDLVEPSDETSNDQKDDSSWFIENNPDTTASFPSDIMDGNNFASSSEIGQSDDIFNNVTSSQTPISFDDDHQQLNTSPPMTEDISTNEKSDQSSLNMFVNDIKSPLQTITQKREEEIAAKDAEERGKIADLRQQAKTDLERWYNDRQQQMELKRQTMKNDEDDLRSKALEKSTKDVCDWSKVIRLLELTDGTQLSKSKRDLTRMKSCMLTAKRINDMKKVENGV